MSSICRGLSITRKQPKPHHRAPRNRQHRAFAPRAKFLPGQSITHRRPIYPKKQKKITPEIHGAPHNLTMSDLDTFTLLPLKLDPQTKAISAAAGHSTRALDAELSTLNALHRALLGLENGQSVPPAPLPVNPKRSANVTKLRESGNAEFRKGKYADAVKFYTLGLQMALTRPAWEPSQLVREEAAQLYSNRAQAHMAVQAWPEGAADAECSVEAKRGGNAKAWWRRGRCLVEMGRLEEAAEWVGRGLEIEGEEKELVELLRDVEGRLRKDKGEKA